ncbi:MAG: MarR family winged helix-turn-helix transcriptional regulator [Flavobacteriaceae bacterium]
MQWNQDRSFGFLLKEVSRRYEIRFERRARTLSLTLSASRALAVLIRNQGVSQSGLSELTNIEPMAMVRVLDRLERMGYITRKPDPKDRRARILKTTPAAEEVVKRIWEMSDQTRAQAFDGISDEERERFIATLIRIGRNLES